MDVRPALGPGRARDVRLSFLSGFFYLGPQSGRLKQIYQTEGVESPAATALLGRLFLASRIELVLLILIVLDMVLKPGL